LQSQRPEPRGFAGMPGFGRLAELFVKEARQGRWSG
jgi:hypothetical protein